MSVPVRYAIQKARGKGWKTLEVGEELPAVETRFHQMIGVNPRAYFRLIRLDPLPGASDTEMEFNWKLVHLHDPNAPGAAGPKRPATARRGPRGERPPARRSAKERVRLPLRFYAVVLVIGLLLGAAAYLRYGIAAG